MHELGCFCAHLSPLSQPGLLAARSRGKKISLPLEKKKILFEKERKTGQSFFYSFLRIRKKYNLYFLHSIHGATQLY